MSKRNDMPRNTFCGRTARREFLHQMGGGFTSLALTGLLGREGFINSQAVAADGNTPWANPLAPKDPPLPAKAKSVIFLFMYGGPSHMDTFEYKPELYLLDGKTIDVKTFGRGGKKSKGRVVGPKWKFKQYGQCGKHVSDLFPNVARHVDKISFLHSMTADSPIHGSAMLMMNSGSVLSGRPSMGSWVNYGLGSVNENLPGYVVMLDRTGGPISGAKNWTSGYMPAAYQGVVMNASGSTPILDLKNARNMSREQQRMLIDKLNKYNSRHLSERVDNSALAARISSYELAYKMQMSAPEAVNFDSEPEHLKKLYGLDQDRTRDFGRKCMLARRLVERGVRFIQVYSGGNHNDANWDATATSRKITTTTPATPTSRSPPCWRICRSAGCWTRHSSSGAASLAANRPPSMPRAPAAIITVTASPCGWPGAVSRAVSALERPTNLAPPPSRNRSTLGACMPPCSSSLASTRTS